MFIVVWNIIILLKYNVIIKLNLFDKQKKLPPQILSLAGFLPPFFFKKFVFHIWVLLYLNGRYFSICSPLFNFWNLTSIKILFKQHIQEPYLINLLHCHSHLFSHP